MRAGKGAGREKGGRKVGRKEWILRGMEDPEKCRGGNRDEGGWAMATKGAW